MKPDGSDLKQHTRHAGWDVASPSLSAGKIVYQLGADLHLFDLVANSDTTLNITLDTDLDQTREHWVQKPMDYLSAMHLSPDGDRVVLTARGKVFVAPLKPGRFVEVTRKDGVRYREARFLPDGKSLLALSDESGEVEFYALPANGVGPPEQLTTDAEVLRWDGQPSPDGKWVAHSDKNQRLYLLEIETKKNKKIDETKLSAGFGDYAWSPDSKWLAYVAAADNGFRRIKLFNVADGKTTQLTTDRYESYSPAWSPDGKWLYFLSDRNLKSIVDDPFGSYGSEPYLDKKTKIYQIALVEGQRSPFAPPTELEDEKKDEPKKEDKKPDDKKPEDKPVVDVKIDLDGIQQRLQAVPVPAGNYSGLSVNDKALFWLTTNPGDKKVNLQGVTIGNDKDPAEVKTIVENVKVVENVSSYDLSDDGKKLLVRKEDTLYILDAVADVADLTKKDVPLTDWQLSVTPREEWRQMFVEAWRLERDYFYDRGMHGVDWKAELKKYQPLVDRINSRTELADLMGQMVSELAMRCTSS